MRGIPPVAMQLLDYGLPCGAAVGRSAVTKPAQASCSSPGLTPFHSSGTPLAQLPILESDFLTSSSLLPALSIRLHLSPTHISILNHPPIQIQSTFSHGCTFSPLPHHLHHRWPLQGWRRHRHKAAMRQSQSLTRIQLASKLAAAQGGAGGPGGYPGGGQQGYPPPGGQQKPGAYVSSMTPDTARPPAVTC